MARRPLFLGNQLSILVVEPPSHLDNGSTGVNGIPPVKAQ